MASCTWQKSADCGPTANRTGLSAQARTSLPTVQLSQDAGRGFVNQGSLTQLLPIDEAVHGPANRGLFQRDCNSIPLSLADWLVCSA